LNSSARAENRTPTNYVETVVPREMEAKEEAARVITMLVPREAAELAPGVRLFTHKQAAAPNQHRGFRLHLNRQAKIPMTTRWIPKLDTPNQGVIAVAPAGLRQELYEITLELIRRYEQDIERLGP
jgi:hypothetical protein